LRIVLAGVIATSAAVALVAVVCLAFCRRRRFLEQRPRRLRAVLPTLGLWTSVPLPLLKVEVAAVFAVWVPDFDL
jgi:EamA domain-containing membrane protein RarD